MQGRLRDEYLGAAEREKLLTAAFDDQKKQANQLNESAIEYSVLKRDAESGETYGYPLVEFYPGVTDGLTSKVAHIERALHE